MRLSAWITLRSFANVNVPLNDYRHFVGPDSAGRLTDQTASNVVLAEPENLPPYLRQLEQEEFQYKYGDVQPARAEPTGPVLTSKLLTFKPGKALNGARHPNDARATSMGRWPHMINKAINTGA